MTELINAVQPQETEKDKAPANKEPLSTIEERDIALCKRITTITAPQPPWPQKKVNPTPQPIPTAGDSKQVAPQKTDSVAQSLISKEMNKDIPAGVPVVPDISPSVIAAANEEKKSGHKKHHKHHHHRKTKDPSTANAAPTASSDVKSSDREMSGSSTATTTSSSDSDPKIKAVQDTDHHEDISKQAMDEIEKKIFAPKPASTSNAPTAAQNHPSNDDAEESSDESSDEDDEEDEPEFEQHLTTKQSQPNDDLQAMEAATAASKKKAKKAQRRAAGSGPAINAYKKLFHDFAQNFKKCETMSKSSPDNVIVQTQYRVVLFYGWILKNYKQWFLPLYESLEEDFSRHESKDLMKEIQSALSRPARVKKPVDADGKAAQGDEAPKNKRGRKRKAPPADGSEAAQPPPAKKAKVDAKSG